MSEHYYIFPGRYQPFHNDHLFVIQEVIARIPDTLIIGIIIHPAYSSNANPDFESEALLQNSAERNPFSPLARIKMINDCIHTELYDLSNRIIPVFLPRPEASWDLVKVMFPITRTWIVPDAGEEFDEMKAKFFASQGDNVLRVPQKSTTSGYLLRKAMSDRSDSWSAHVPQTIANHIGSILRHQGLTNV